MDASRTMAGPERDGRGRWMPGQSGNAAGKAPGTRNRGTVLREQLGAATEDTLSRSVQTVVRRVDEGSYSAACFVLNGLAPNARGRAIALDLPPDAEPDAVMDAIMRDVIAGEITLDEAMGYVRLLKEQIAIRQLCAARRRADAAPAESDRAAVPAASPAPVAAEPASTPAAARPARRVAPAATASAATASAATASARTGADQTGSAPAFHLQMQGTGPVSRAAPPVPIAAAGATPSWPAAPSRRSLLAGVALPRPPGPPIIRHAPAAAARGPGAGLSRAA